MPPLLRDVRDRAGDRTATRPPKRPFLGSFRDLEFLGNRGSNLSLRQTILRPSYEKTSIRHLRRTRLMIGPCLRPPSLRLNFRKSPPCSETDSERRLRRLSAFNPSASHTSSNGSLLAIPLAKTQDNASLKDSCLSRFAETPYPRKTLIASASTASIRRCSLDNVRAPTDSKNWLGSRSRSGISFR